MKAYLSVPIIMNRNISLARTLAEVISSCHLIIVSQWVLTDDPVYALSPEFVYKRDIDALDGSDVIVADISSPSVGVGMEIMYANMHRKMVICAHERGKPLSRLLRGMPNKIIVDYDTLDELKVRLSDALQKLSDC